MLTVAARHPIAAAAKGFCRSIDAYNCYVVAAKMQIKRKAGSCN